MAKRNWYQAAATLWPVLTNLARERRTAPYSELSPLVETNPLSMGLALGPIMFYCLENRLPPLTAVVVSKDTHVPGGGFTAWDIDDLPAALEAVFDHQWSRVLNPFAAFHDGTRMEDLVDQLVDRPGRSEEVYRLVPDRGVAQALFRKALLEAYPGCCFCGLTFEDALEAAHIVPWAEASRSERLDVRNGLLLCATHHRMFDAALMTLDESRQIQFYDPDENDVPYTDADRALSSRLHTRPAHIPDKPELQPGLEFILRRRALDDW
jgi:putative restriction endonuclease